jgi:hypothetical protein
MGQQFPIEVSCQSDKNTVKNLAQNTVNKLLNRLGITLVSMINLNQ